MGVLKVALFVPAATGTTTMALLDAVPCDTEESCYAIRDIYPKFILSGRVISKYAKFLQYNDNGIYLTRLWDTINGKCKNINTTMALQTNDYGTGNLPTRCWYKDLAWITSLTTYAPYASFSSAIKQFIDPPTLCSNPSLWGWDYSFCHGDGDGGDIIYKTFDPSTICIMP